MENLEIPEEQAVGLVDGEKPEAAEPVSEEEFKYDLDGKSFGREDVDKALKNYLNDTSWQAKNTRKSQELADMERNFQKVSQLENYLKAHPELEEKVVSLFKEYSSQPGDDGKPKADPIVMSQYQDLQHKVETQLEYMNLQNDLSKLRSKTEYKEYFDADPELDKKLCRYMLEHEIGNVNTAFKDMMFDQVQSKTLEKGIKQAKEGIQKSRSLGQPSGSGKVNKAPGKMEGLNAFKEALMKDDRLGSSE